MPAGIASAQIDYKLFFLHLMIGRDVTGAYDADSTFSAAAQVAVLLHEKSRCDKAELCPTVTAIDAKLRVV
jgi:hypothetical protein